LQIGSRPIQSSQIAAPSTMAAVIQKGRLRLVMAQDKHSGPAP
jgi:hypothetical protein